jgi:hypothetical protein
MAYLSVRKFWDYQNADVWKKCKGHPPWFKLFVHRDGEIDMLPPLARLLWYELLSAATRHANVLQADLKWLSSETHLDRKVIAEMLPLLVKGGWLSETDTPRRSRTPSRKIRDKVATRSRSRLEEESSSEGLFVVQDAQPPPEVLDIRNLIKTTLGEAS